VSKQAPRVAVLTYAMVPKLVVEQADHYIEMTVEQAKVLVKRLQKRIEELEVAE